MMHTDSVNGELSLLDLEFLSSCKPQSRAAGLSLCSVFPKLSLTHGLASTLVPYTELGTEEQFSKCWSIEGLHPK